MKKKTTYSDIKCLTFDTGGTVLDWHSGFRDAFKMVGEKYGIKKDWGAIANKLRKKSMNAMLQLGETEPPAYNFDGAHKFCLDEVVAEEELSSFTEEDADFIAYETPHNFKCWPDFPSSLARIQKSYLVCSFTILSYRLIIDTARKNNIVWDAVFSCEGIGKYKMLQEPYNIVASHLQFNPIECLMVACHPWDLDAAKKAGYRTAFVKRPTEWGQEPPPWMGEGPDQKRVDEDSYDIVVDNFSDLANVLC